MIDRMGSLGLIINLGVAARQPQPCGRAPQSPTLVVSSLEPYHQPLRGSSGDEPVPTSSFAANLDKGWDNWDAQALVADIRGRSSGGEVALLAPLPAEPERSVTHLGRIPGVVIRSPGSVPRLLKVPVAVWPRL